MKLTKVETLTRKVVQIYMVEDYKYFETKLRKGDEVDSNITVEGYVDFIKRNDLAFPGATEAEILLVAEQVTERVQQIEKDVRLKVKAEVKTEMKKLVDVKTVKELLAENEQFTEADIYRFYDVKDDGTQIARIYSGGEEAGIAGVEYEDGTYYVVGCRTDCRVGTFDDMITLVEESI